MKKYADISLDDGHAITKHIVTELAACKVEPL
jgi:hypothetical protein